MELFYSESQTHPILKLVNEEHIHCTKSLRHVVGDIIFVADGVGNRFECKIMQINKQETTLSILKTETYEKTDPPKAIAITPTKNPSRLEWFVEKATEIGVDEIIIFISARTEKKHINKQRIQKIVISAMKQSLHFFKPKISYYNSLSDLLEAVGSDFNQKFIAHCEDPTAFLGDLCDLSKSKLVLIGPEGDFTNDEVNLALKSGFQGVSLGNTRLRTETAGVVALVIVSF